MRRPTRPWLFGVINVPYGTCSSGIVTTVLPFLLRARGVSVETISSVVAVAVVPTIWYFVWAPLVDVKWRRRTWLVASAIVSAACMVAALMLPLPGALRAITVLVVGGIAINQLVGAAVGGLVADTVPNHWRGAAAGWTQAANLGGGVVAGGLLVWLSARSPTAFVAMVAGLLIVLPSLPVLSVDEPPPAGRGAREHFGLMLRDLRITIRSPRVWLGFAWFLSPVGAGALMNLFSAIAVDYHASSTAVALGIGVFSGLVTAVGALVGGFACDRFDRWLVYPVAGLLSAVCAGGMTVAPLTPTVYVVGASAYSFASGFGYATFSALAFDLLGDGGAAAGTRSALFVSAANVPLAYMTWVDGVGHSRFGVRGLLAFDSISNVLSSLMLMVFLVWLRQSKASICSADRAVAASTRCRAANA